MFISPLLAKLYVKKSLKNTAEGFEFRLRNIIDSATLVAFGPVKVDGAVFGPGLLSLTQEGATVRGDEVAASNPVAIRAFRDTLVGVRGNPLGPGAHKITVEGITLDVGRITFDVKDSVDG